MSSRPMLADLLRPETEGGLQGWCDRPKGEFLYDTVRQLARERPGPLSCVEVGVFGGRSLIPVALGLRDCDGGFVTGIDPYTTAANVDGWGAGSDVREWVEHVPFEAIRRRCEGVIEVLGLRRWCAILRCEASRAAHQFGPVDLVHIDGNHAEASALRDVRTWLPKLTTGSVIVIDDTNWDTVQAAREVVARRCQRLHAAATWEAYRRE